MNKPLFILLIAILTTLVTACSSTAPTPPIPAAPSPAPTATSLSTTLLTQTTTPTPSPSPTLTATQTPMPTSLISRLTIPADAHLKIDCLEVSPSLPIDTTSSGIVVLQGGENPQGGTQSGTYFRNMLTGQSTQVAKPYEFLNGYKMSPDRKRIAFLGGSIIQDQLQLKLIVMDSNGVRLKEIPWDIKKWSALAGWLDNQHLGIHLASSDKAIMTLRKPGSLLVLDPFSGANQTLDQNYPGYLHSPMTIIPDWEGWFGVVYDPTFSLAVYPYTLGGGNNETYTYAIENVKQREFIANLKNIFTTYAQYNFYSMPRWSPDGSHFVMEGIVGPMNSNSPITEFELFLVNRDGNVEQLTHLTDTATIWESFFSWSPDGRHIAMLLGPSPLADSVSGEVAVLDIKTKEVTDYCVPIKEIEGGGDYSHAPIWSPDGTQLLVTDWYEKSHKHTYILDITHNLAAQLSDDLAAVAWLQGSE